MIRDLNFDLITFEALMIHHHILQTEAELLAEKRCVAHLTGEVNIIHYGFFFFDKNVNCLIYS